jgi:hypothetical protein
MCVYKALMNTIVQSLAVPVRHRQDLPTAAGCRR